MVSIICTHFGLLITPCQVSQKQQFDDNSNITWLAHQSPILGFVKQQSDRCSTGDQSADQFDFTRCLEQQLARHRAKPAKPHARALYLSLQQLVLRTTDRARQAVDVVPIAQRATRTSLCGHELFFELHRVATASQFVRLLRKADSSSVVSAHVHNDENHENVNNDAVEHDDDDSTVNS